jgi:hypothetical protein
MYSQLSVVCQDINVTKYGSYTIHLVLTYINFHPWKQVVIFGSCIIIMLLIKIGD